LSLGVSLSLKRWKGVVFRAHHPKWAFDPLSGEGARMYGGRFNALGTPALYTSLTPEGAWAEAQQGFAFKAQPLTLVAYRIDCADVLDLSTSKACARAGIDLLDLSWPWEDFAARKLPVPTWLLQERLIGERVAAIIVPSFAPAVPTGACNMVFWDWGSALPHKVEIVDDFGRLVG
jgi:RES domain-containing protein